MYITNLTVDEYFKLNSDSIPCEVQAKFYELLEQVEAHKQESERGRLHDEIRDEQLAFARELLDNIDHFVASSKYITKKEKMEYAMIKENSYFEQ